MLLLLFQTRFAPNRGKAVSTLQGGDFSFADKIQCGGDGNAGEIACMSGGPRVGAGAASVITSGGGFSQMAKTAWYQEQAVDEYLKTPGTTPPASGPTAQYFNKNGRGYPDVSAVGNNYLILQQFADQKNASYSSQSGTSASTPAVAAMVSLLNDHRHHLGLGSLGFLNPLFYNLAQKRPEVFRDVTVGDNSCSEDGFCCLNGVDGKDPVVYEWPSDYWNDYNLLASNLSIIREDIRDRGTVGFKTSRGWDAVTGLGTIDYQAMHRVVMEKAEQQVAAKQQASTSNKIDGLFIGLIILAVIVVGMLAGLLLYVKNLHAQLRLLQTAQDVSPADKS